MRKLRRARGIAAFTIFWRSWKFKARSWTQAAVTAQKAMQLNSGDGEAVMLYAQIEVQRGQTANAVSAWEKWQAAHPNDAGVLAILGTLEESRGDTGKAEAYYRRSLQIQPQQPIAANNLAYRMLMNGENVDVALIARANGPAGYAELSQYRGHTGVGLLLQGNLRICARSAGGSDQDRTEQRCNAVSPGDGVQQTSG